MLTYQMLYQCLIEAEERRDNKAYPQDVRERSAETVSLIFERMATEGLTRDKLQQLAKV